MNIERNYTTSREEVINMSERSSELLFPSLVRRQVLEQHNVLRRLLQAALDETTRGLQGEGTDLGQLSASAQDLHRRFHAHLTFEERALVPILDAMDLWGPERVADLLGEHERQRAELDTILEGIAEGWDLGRLALTLRSLVADLLRDMDEEEAGCLSAELLREETVRGQHTRL
jgi:hypothetical protein